ncbi:MAG: hypothetical protein ACOY8P_08610 [Thermodesulfobacteriota bacterium]
MKSALNFFDRLMIAITFAEANVDPAECSPAATPAAKARAGKATDLAHAATKERN